MQPIPGAFLSTAIPAGGTITITKQPANVTAAQNDFISLSVELTASQAPVVQWQKNGTSVPGLTGTAVTVGPLAAGDIGAKFRALISIPGATVTSTEATLTVIPDVTPPKIQSVSGSDTFDALTVEFSEAVTAASVEKAASYSLDGGLTVSSATVLSPTRVKLVTSKQTAGSTYTLTIKDIVDTAGISSAADTKLSFPAFASIRGGLKFEAFTDIASTAVQTLLDDPKYQANTPDVVGFISQFTSRLIYPDNASGLAGRENYGGRMSGWIVPPETANYEFFLRSDDASHLYLSTDETPEKAVLIAQENGCCGPFEEPGAGDNGDGTFPTSPPISLTQDKRYYIYALWKEGGGGDYCDVAWRKAGDTPVPRTLPYIPGTVLETYGAPGTFTAPTVAVTSPAGGSAFEIGAPVSLTASASAAPGKTIVKLEYLEQGRIVGESTTSPYAVTLFGLAEGAHKFTARVTDSAGIIAETAPVDVSVGLPTKQIELVRIDDKTTWRYDRSGQDLGTTWREKTYDDSKWPEGKALIADESTTTAEPIRTAINRFNDANEYVKTFYFRTRFNFNDDITPGVKLKLRHVVDDGAVFYLNGVEIHRFGIAADVAVDATTDSSGHENAYEGPYDIPIANLVKGENVLTAEVHQSGGSSSDMVFGGELIATVPCVPREIGLLKIDDATTWRYDRSGQDLGTEWRERAYNDSQWPQGKALIADESTTTVEPIRTAINRFNDANEYVKTFYFRGHFNFPGTSTAGAKLKLRHVIDDGAVIYLNGAEIHRFGIAADVAVDATTDAGGHENAYEGPYDIPLDKLVPGENVLAAEVHQSGGSSSDMVFGIELIATITDCGTTEPPPTPKQPVMTVTRSAANIQISWTEGGTLQSADAVTGAWTDVANATSPHTAAASEAAKFFRVKR
ncbi:MAG: Ig-like domain-containing protein [Verrucomicrobiales bacterium]|nr:Ig-like domain-containing protein [Verrucomicrobiales bacterium]